LWPHIDRFGHAKRYLNWNKWFFDGESINDICYELPIPERQNNEASSLIETEAKYEVTDPELLDKLLRANGFTPHETVWQRDEYFDNDAAALSSLDFVIRLRKDLESFIIGFKGPRFYTNEGEYSRIEIEVPAGPETKVRAALSALGLNTTWFFEKRRTEYRHKENPILVVIDEVPEAGYYAEIEGPLQQVREVQVLLSPGLGLKETRNYAELFIAFKEKQGLNKSDVKGASFSGE
jgi:predicted adenylyl cyclase CyaB